MRDYVVTVKIEFTSLDRLVAYLRERDVQQKQIDTLAEKLNQLTAKLHNSTTGLQGSAETQTA